MFSTSELELQGMSELKRQIWFFHLWSIYFSDSDSLPRFLTVVILQSVAGMFQQESNNQENKVSALSNGTYFKLIDSLNFQDLNLIWLKCIEIGLRSGRTGASDLGFFSVLYFMQLFFTGIKHCML